MPPLVPAHIAETLEIEVRTADVVQHFSLPASYLFDGVRQLRQQCRWNNHDAVEVTVQEIAGLNLLTVERHRHADIDDSKLPCETTE